MNPETDNTNLNIQITRYLAGEASPQEIEDLLHWIEQSDENRRYFIRQQDIWSALNPVFDIEEIDMEKSERSIMFKTGIKGNGFIIAFRKFVKFCSRFAAAAFLPLLAVALYFFIQSRDSEQQLISVKTTYGCTSQATLPDGTDVWLNANSTIQYPAKFKEDTREVILNGEAYFDVQSDKAHPFKVSTTYLSVTATGTQFNVNAYDPSASVTLVEGKVDVETPVDRISLKPGDHLAMHNGIPQVDKAIDTEKYCSWKEGVIIFDDERLDKICSTLHHIYGVDFEIAPELTSRTFHMVLRGENLQEILHFLEMTAPVRCIPDEESSSTDSIRISQKIYIKSK